VDAVHTRKAKQQAWKNKRQPAKQYKDKHEAQSGAEHKTATTVIRAGIMASLLKV